MISNNGTIKIKSLKTSHELDTESEVVNKGQGSVREGPEGDFKRPPFGSRESYNSRTVVSNKDREKADFRPATRQKFRDERMARGGTYRCNSRGGRGGSSFSSETRKNKIFVDTYPASQKYEASKENSKSSSGKILEASDLAIRSKTDLQNILSDDCRISKVMRRLAREEDPEKFLALGKQLQENIMLCENNNYIRHSFDLIVESLLDLLHSAPNPAAKLECAKCLGKVGYVLENNFKRFLDWIFDKFNNERNDEVRVLLVKSLGETLILEKEKPVLKEFATILMAQMKLALESTDFSDLLIASVEVILLLIDIYPDSFHKHFKDTVDILVGWGLSLMQPNSLINFAVESLSKLQCYWVTECTFAMGLLKQFLEDTEGYLDDLQLAVSNQEVPEGSSPVNSVQIMVGLLKIFNTVTNCVAEEMKNSDYLPTYLIKMLTVVNKAVAIVPNDNLIRTANAGTSLILNQIHSRSPVANQLVLDFVRVQLSLMDMFEEETVSSFLQFVTKVIQELKTVLTPDFVSVLIGPGSLLEDLKLSNSQLILDQLVVLYQTLLCDNVFQGDIFSYIFNDLKTAIHVLSSPDQSEMPYSLKEAEIIAVFYLEILSACKMSTVAFEMLLKMNPSCKELGQRSPSTQLALLWIIYSHCTVYGNFLRSSRLLNINVPPMCNYFSGILAVISEMLVQNIGVETLHLLLKWCEDIISGSLCFLPTLIPTHEFRKFLNSLCHIGRYPLTDEATMKICSCFEQLVVNPDFIFKSDVIDDLLQLCCHHHNSLNPIVAEKFSQLLLKIPISKTLTITKIVEKSDLKKSVRYKSVTSVLREYFSKGTYGFMETRHFSAFMDYLLLGVRHRDYMWLQEMFLECYPLQIQNVSALEHGQWLEMKRTSMENTEALIPWACWEAAQLCVLNKLRTPLGKPPETFTNIEMAIRSLARQTKLPDNPSADGLYVTEELKRARILLDFLEYLEKLMYNASEGTASALLAPPKNVRTFFHANKGTCASWLNRIRLHIIIVAMHSGQPTLAVRNGHCLLNELMESRNTQGQEFEIATMYTAWALLSLRESEAIVGLYVWCRQEGNRKFSWLKAMADHAGGRYETAIEGYKAILMDGQIKCPSVHEAMKVIDPNASPVKQTKSLTLLIIQRLIQDCMMQCYKKINDYENLQFWIDNVDALVRDDSNSNNGTSLERFYHHSMPDLDLQFIQSIQGIIANKAKKYQTKYNNVLVNNSLMPGNHESVSVVNEYDQISTFPNIQYIDASILEAKISYVHNDYDEHCKKTLASLCDWAEIEKDDKYESLAKSWSYYSLVENLKNILVKNCIFINVGKNLENNSCVFQMNENNKIEIDLHFKLLLEKWGVRNYDFELSNILKEIKENYVTKKDRVRSSIEECSKIINSLMRENIRSGDNELSQEIVILDYVCWDLMNSLNHVENVKFRVNEKFSSDVLLSLGFWKKLMNEDDLNLQIIKSARKEGNFNLSRRALLWYFDDDKSDRSLVEISGDLIENFDRDLTIEEGELCLQVAKLLHSTGANVSAIDLASLSALKLIRPDNSLEHKRAGSRILLSLAKWLQRDGFNEDSSNLQAVYNLIDIHEAGISSSDVLLMPYNSVNDQKVIPDADMLIGQILSMSVSHCPSLAKTWSCYASWCYRWGRKIVDVASRAGGSLSELDLVKIKQMLPYDTTEAQLHEIIMILSHTRAVADEDSIEAESLNTSEIIRNQLQSVPVLASASEDVLAILIDIWRVAQSRIYSGFHKAAQAYFKYLQLCAQTESDNCYTITATLRVLRLLVKHALELQAILEEELPRTPTRPWQCIIPQLFSRLNHPEAYVRKCLSELLCRIAEVSQNLITFPAVVGASAGRARRIADIHTSTSKLLGTCLSQNSREDDGEEDEEEEFEEEEEEEEEDEESATAIDNQNSVLTNCFQAMVDTLSKRTPVAISQVQTFVSELRRITLLWDELWLGTLNQHQTELNRRLYQLEEEVRRVENNTSLSSEEKSELISEKHRIILKPVVFVLEQLHSITSVPPQTPHEIWFQEKFGKQINEALEKLKNPADPRKPMESWHSFKTIHAKMQKRRSCSSLRMKTISPILANFRNTDIAMPGLTSGPNNEIVKITTIDNSIVVLPTKTKPKKLIFHGSDGNQYTYLFKGLEDLHLDERIMQFLTISNTMMSSNGDTSYQARHYSVTPLGPRSGLISWVDNVTPLFSLYKKWQQRDSSNASLKQGSTSNSGHTTMRPSELFYAKLTPLLKEAGIMVENRKDWPVSILIQVLQELMLETPKDLLAKELWCTTVNADEWWMATRRYCRSVAVMSVIGYIIGLGDRHLDNVLIDLNTGEMVHIDYNVCFEKGKTLRVPEKVPFRMTQNIKTALGITGIEGQFRLACEHVLKIVKKGRDTLLPLLEAFVYDPLIDWTPGNETGYTGAVYGGGEAVLKETRQSRKALEREMTKAMFIVRVTEMKADWIENRDQILTIIPVLVSQLKEYLKIFQDMKKSEENLADAHQQMALVKEAEAQGHKHPLFNLATRCSELLAARSAHNATKKILKEKIEEYDKDINNYTIALSSIKGDSLSQWINHLGNRLHPDSFQTFDLVKEFLQTAGQSNMVSQCDQAESEVGQMDQQQRQITRKCVDLLGEYAALIALYPCCSESHRSRKYKIWSETLLENMSIETCQNVMSEFQKTFGNERPNCQVTSKQVFAYTFSLQSAVREAQRKLNKCVERMQDEGLPEARMKYEQDFNEIKERISEFSKLDKKSGLAMELVTITGLCAINRRFIQLEVAAKSAEDELFGMKLKEGQGWLEEMYIVSGLINEMTSQLPTQLASQNSSTDTTVESVINCLRKAHSIFNGLLELNYNFHSIILPEALKWTQIEHPDMLSMVSELDNIVQGSGITLDELQKQLKLHLRCLIMGMKSQHSDVQSKVSYLRSQYELLLQRPCEDAVKSPGQMLLMGFNGLFEKLQVEGSQLTSTLCALSTPSSWQKVDQLKEANTLTALVLNETTRSVTDDIFLVKRMQTMQEFFQLCNQAGKAFRGDGAPVVHDDERLYKPIRRFTAEYVSRTMLGVTSQTLAIALCFLLERIGFNVTGEIEEKDVGVDGKVPLEDLCRRAIDVSLHKSFTTNHAVSQASSYSNTLQSYYRQKEKISLTMQNADAKNCCLTRLQILLTAHSWYHEDILQESCPNNAVAMKFDLTIVITDRSTFMTKLRKSSSSLMALQTKLTEARDLQKVLISNVEQRLKWAAGANPAIHEVMAAFESTVSQLDQRLNEDQALATAVAHTCSSILRYEALRTRTSEALLNDEAMLKIIMKCEETSNWIAGCTEYVSPAEESLLELMTPEYANDPKRLQKLEAKIAENIESMKTSIQILSESLYATKQEFEAKLLNLRQYLGSHHYLMTEIRHLLKSLAKFEECSSSGLPQFLEKYRSFSEDLGFVGKQLTIRDGDYSPEDIENALAVLQKLPERIVEIYDELIGFASDKSLKEAPVEGFRKKTSLMKKQNEQGKSVSVHENRDPRTGKTVQERNAYAMNVWRRIQMKLEGRDPDPGRRCTAHEQIEYIIREATSIENLALLYEGWTPWV